jgi:hypothetical protein
MGLMMIEVTLRTDGGYDISISGADACFLGTLVHEQQIPHGELLARLLAQEMMRTNMNPIRRPTLVK